MATELHTIGPDEISLVDRGANQRPILVRKRDGGEMTDEERTEFTKQLDTLRSLAGDRLEIIKDSVEALVDFENMEKGDVADAFDAISSQLWDARGDVMALAKRDDDTEPVTLAKTLVAIAKIIGVEISKATRLGDRLTALRDEKELTTMDLAEAAGIDESTMTAILGGDIARPPDERLRGLARLLDVSFDSLLELIPEDVRMVEKVELNEEQMAALDAVRAMLAGGDAASEEQAALVASVLDLVTEAGGVYPKPAEEVEMQDEEEEVEMSKRDDLPEEVKKALRESAEEVAKIKKQLKAETDKRQVTEQVARVEKRYPNILVADTAGPVLKSIKDKVSEDEWTWINEQLDSAQEIAKASGLFTEEGSTGQGNDADDPAAQLQAIAKQLHDDGKADTFAKAYVKASEANPELVRKINAQTRSN